MTPQQVADALQVSRPTVLRWVDAGRLAPASEPNPVLQRRWMRFRESDVETLRAALLADAAARKANPPPRKPRRKAD